MAEVARMDFTCSNFFNVTAPMLREIGDPNVLAKLDKTYLVNVRDYSPELYVTGGSRHQNLTVLNPSRPLRCRMASR